MVPPQGLGTALMIFSIKVLSSTKGTVKSKTQRRSSFLTSLCANKLKDRTGPEDKSGCSDILLQSCRVTLIRFGVVLLFVFCFAASTTYFTPGKRIKYSWHGDVTYNPIFGR